MRVAGSETGAEVAVGEEPDALLRARDHHGLADRRQIAADPPELRRRHRQHALVLRVLPHTITHATIIPPHTPIIYISPFRLA